MPQEGMLLYNNTADCIIIGKSKLEFSPPEIHQMSNQETIIASQK